MAETKEPHPKAISYRPDIDGMRAVAVTAVLLYHARLGVPGGFVGVDIFFVLSGFLITSIILKDAASAKGFSIVSFWERRIRRILPALFVTLVSTVITGWFVLLPSDFEGLGKSVLAQAVFAGNFYFCATAGYFDSPALYKPLLHTWSLAVEEQYYLFFPILFLPWWKLKIPLLRWVIGAAAVISIALSIVLTKTAPDVAFYLLPSRAWELFGGALLAMMPYTPNIPRWAGEAVGWGGVAAIVAAYWGYNSQTPFPGAAALLPCAGALAIIWANDLGEQSCSVRRLLALPPVVFVGKISYSLYLWHWPVLVYASYWKNYGALPWTLRVGLLVLSFVLAVLSWRFVETPFRLRQVLARRRAIFAFGLVAPATCAAIGAVLILSHGIPARFPAGVVVCDADREGQSMPLGDQSHAEILQNVRQGDFLQRGPNGAPTQCLLWGDSHAYAISPALIAAAAQSPSRVELAVYSATCPVLDYESAGKNSLGPDSKAWSDAIVDHVRQQHIRNVVVAAHWDIYFDGAQSSQDLAAKLKATTLALQQAGARVWIVKDVPYQPVDVPKALAKAIWSGSSLDVGVTKEDYLASSQKEDAVLAPAAASGATILNPAPYLFHDRPTALLIAEGHPLYVDHEHLSNRGALLMTDLFQPIWAK